MTISDRIIVSFHRERMNEVARTMRYKRSFWTNFAFLSGVVFLMASTVYADTVEQGLVQVPAPIKDRTRAMIQKGVPSEDAIQLIQAMIANRFHEEQILKAQAIVLETQG